MMLEAVEGSQRKKKGGDLVFASSCFVAVSLTISALAMSKIGNLFRYRSRLRPTSEFSKECTVAGGRVSQRERSSSAVNAPSVPVMGKAPARDGQSSSPR